MSEERQLPRERVTTIIPSQLAWIICIIWLATIGIVALVWELGAIGLVDETEPLFAEAARQMTVTGDWVTPFFNGETRFDKPPLIYWAIAFMYRCIGVNTWAVRLPSAIAAIALGFFVFYTLRRSGKFSHNRPFWIAGCIAGTLTMFNVQTIAWGRTGVSDMLLSAGIGSALLAFFIGYSTPNREQRAPWYRAFFILCAIAVLVKGPVGVVLPGLIIICFLVYVGQLKTVLAEIELPTGILWFLALTLPWYILVTLANGWNYINSFFGYHNIERFTSVVNNHSAPWYFYIPTIAVGFFPWSLYLPLAIGNTRFWRRRYWQRQPRTQHLQLFVFFWLFCIFAFFTIAVTKLPSYVLPAMPACAILVAFVWNEPSAASEVKNPGLFWSGLANVAICLSLAVAFPFAIPFLGNDPAMPEFGLTLQASGFILQATLHYGILAIALLLAVWGRWWRGLWSINAIAFAAFMLLIVTPISAIADAQRQLPLRQIAQTVIATRQSMEPLIMVGFWKPSLTFYTQGPVIYGHHAGQALVVLGQVIRNPITPNTMLIVGRPETFVEMGFQPQQYELLQQEGTYQLVRITQAEVIRTLNTNPIAESV